MSSATEQAEKTLNETNSKLEEIKQLRNHIEMCAESILEHTSNLEDMKEDLIDSIIDGYDVKLEELVAKRLDARIEIILKKHNLI